MATIADLLVKIGADTSDLRKELNATKRQIKSAFGSEALDVSKKSLAVLGGIGAGLAALGGGIGESRSQSPEYQDGLHQYAGQCGKGPRLSREDAGICS